MAVLLLGLVALAALAWITPRILRRLIEWRLGAYVRTVNRPDERLPLRLEGETRRVAVLGAGVAGLTAAVTLARRGYAVTLIEKNDYLGGKLGSWEVTLDGQNGAPPRRVWVSHGFHAFFAHYYNLNRFLDARDLRRTFRSIGDYVILGRNGDEQRFAGLAKTPVLNLVSMWWKGAFSLGDALRAPGRDCYGVFLEYDEEKTFAELDHLSFAEFSRRAEVPPRLRLAFNTFARAFFADEDRLSLAELVKSFHFYYLSHDGGLVYDYPDRDYEAAILAPLRAELEAHGAEVRLGTAVATLEHLPTRDQAKGQGKGNGPDAARFLVDGQPFDRVIVATDVVGAAKILGGARGVPESVKARYGALRPGQRYAVYRIWIDRDLRANLPVFVITERKRVLDSVTTYHRFEQETILDLRDTPGLFCLELHCYAVPDELSEAEVRDAFMDELVDYFPEVAGFTISHTHLQLERNFTAFHVGRHAERPGVETGVPGLTAAGDWVRLPFPAMLLEAAAASGLVAANTILTADGLREEQVLSVPPRGLMAGIAPPPGRKKALGL